MTSATRRHKVCRWLLNTHEIAVFCRWGLDSPSRILLDDRFFQNCCSNSTSVFWKLFRSISASQQYKIRPYRMKTQEVTDSCGGSHYIKLGGIIFDRIFLHNHCSDSNSVSSRWLGSISASQPYKACPYRIATEEVAVPAEYYTLAEFYSIADSSTTAVAISNLFLGRFWARQ